MLGKLIMSEAAERSEIGFWRNISQKKIRFLDRDTIKGGSEFSINSATLAFIFS
jgi:hypothetical protein